MARRSFMSSRASEAALELGKKSKSKEGSASIFDGFNIDIQRISQVKGDDVKVVNEIVRSLFNGTAGLWAMIYQYDDVLVEGKEIQIPLHRYVVDTEEKPLIATLTCAKYIAAILKAAKTLGLLESEITGKTVTADSELFVVYFTPENVEQAQK